MIECRLSEVDYRENEEERQVHVIVTKVDENVVNLTLRVTPVTFNQFSSTNITLPNELVNTLLDPAECKSV